MPVFCLFAEMLQFVVFVFDGNIYEKYWLNTELSIVLLVGSAMTRTVNSCTKQFSADSASF